MSGAIPLLPLCRSSMDIVNFAVDIYQEILRLVGDNENVSVIGFTSFGMWRSCWVGLLTNGPLVPQL